MKNTTFCTRTVTTTNFSGRNELYRSQTTIYSLYVNYSTWHSFSISPGGDIVLSTETPGGVLKRNWPILKSTVFKIQEWEF